MPDQDQDGAAASPPDLRTIARDWITVWQSELNALAVDREAAEGWTRAVGLWAEAAAAAAMLLPGAPPHEPAGRPGPAAPAGPTAAAAAPDGRGGDARGGDARGGNGRDAAVEQLGHRIAELERRLATLER